MKAVILSAEWSPKTDFTLGKKDMDGKLTYLGSKVWRHPRVEIAEIGKPAIKEDEVLVRVRACGICGSDVHMAQADRDGYIFYPGLTAFPVVLGHEFAGVVAEAGKNAVSKRTGKRFSAGEPVCAEEMIWCSYCRPCADGYPNHCENLQELGFSVAGAFTEYVAINARYLWSLDEMKRMYGEGDELFVAGSLVEPCSVAYNAVIERAGGIRAGDNVVILGGGPIGLAAAAILRRSGAARVILSEPQPERAHMAMKMGVTDIINPEKDDFAERILELTDGYGASLYLEATGMPDRVFPGIERALWEGRALNARVVIVARADAKIPVTGEVFQVRRAAIIGAQGHSGHGTFPRVIAVMASGMDMRPIVTKRIKLADVPKNIIALQTDRKECKVTAII
ncbi:MAG: scyllo-inosose 3-dehydrogenase [Kiritimatiellae bacterium]|nr:scyllo-inosose 3-dehydrogenase [Kiritimatiellia bacterium]